MIMQFENRNCHMISYIILDTIDTKLLLFKFYSKTGTIAFGSLLVTSIAHYACRWAIFQSVIYFPKKIHCENYLKKVVEFFNF